MSGIAPKSNLDNGGLTAEEQKDPFGQDYRFTYIDIAPTERGSNPTKRMIFLFTGSKLKNLGIISEEITLYL